MQSEIIQQCNFAFNPRLYQRKVLEQFPGEKNRAVCVWHRRAGKDLTMFNKMGARALRDKPGSYYFIYPSYTQGKKILWQGMDKEGRRYIDYLPEGSVVDKNETDMQLWLRNGSLIQVVGSEKIDSIVGTNPKGLVYSEYSLQNPRAWDLLEPILLENGGWAAFIYTPRGRNHGYRLYNAASQNPSWFCEVLTIRDTKREDGSPVITEEQINELRRGGKDETLIQQEYYCSFEGAVQGSYYDLSSAYTEGRIGEFPWHPTRPVGTAWDIGTGDTTVVIFYQQNGPWFDVIDIEEASGKGVDYWAKLVNAKPYVYERLHNGPHDLEQRHWAALGRTVTSIASEYGLHFRSIAKTQIEDGIAAVRRLLPRLRFHKKVCADKLFYGHTFLDAIAQYHKEYDEEKQCFIEHPDHDWSSHSADALRIMAQAVNIPAERDAFQIRTETKWNPFAKGADEAQYEQDGVRDELRHPFLDR
jgi:hypothetical protein